MNRIDKQRPSDVYTGSIHGVISSTFPHTRIQKMGFSPHIFPQTGQDAGQRKSWSSPLPSPGPQPVRQQKHFPNKRAI